MLCLDDTAIDRFVRGELDPASLDAIDSHIDGCADCRAKVGARALAVPRSAAGSAKPSDGEWGPVESHSTGRAGAAPSEGAETNAAKKAIPIARTVGGREPIMSLAPAPDPYVGRLLAGRYQIHRVIGAGGMGSVYEAEHALIGRRVAIKILHPQFAGSRDIVRRFQNEARAAATLGHPAIVQALDMGHSEEGMPFLVLEYLEGKNLENEIGKGPMAIGKAIAIARSIADALAAAHAAGIVHRDLKPENVFLTSAGAIKVLDFGVSKFASSSLTGPGTAPGALMGTPMYMAPEQLEDAGNADPRSDVFALGVILYQMLSGGLPFVADSLPQLYLKLLSGRPPSVRAVRPDVPEGLDRAISRALAGTPSERFASMTELAAELARFETLGGPISSAPEERSERRVATVLAAIGIGDRNRLLESIEAQDGRVVDGGDPLLAVFGAETWQGDEVLRAVLAALGARPAVDAVGVATGHVERSGEVVRGSAVDRALEACDARLQGVAVVEPSSRVESRFVVRRVTEELGEATGKRATGWSIVPGADGESRPLLGRSAQVAELRAAIGRTRVEERPALAFLSGPPGMGKTRLAAEVVRLAELDWPEARVLVGRASSERGQRRGLLVSAIEARARHAALTDSRFDLDPSRPVEDRRRAVNALAAEASSEPLLPAFLGELLGVAMPSSPHLDAARANPRLMSDRLDLALRAYFDGLTERYAVVLIVEDLQWADDDSLELLNELTTDLAASRPLFVVGTARTDGNEPGPAPFDGPDVVELRLRGLSIADIQTFASWIAGEELAEPLARAIAERTGGNPFFVEQTVEALLHEGKRLGDVDPRGLPLPVDVAAALQARFDALEPLERSVLRAACVWAGSFTAADLGAVASLDPATVGLTLDALVKRGLLRQRGARAHGARFEVQSSLVADVAYGLLTEERKRELHLAAARALSLRSSPEPEILALHFDRAGARVEAASLYLRAALEALRRYDAPRVLRAASRALALGPEPTDRLALLMALSEVHEAEGRFDEQREVLARAEPLAVVPEERATVLVARAVWTLRVESPAQSLPLFEAAVAAAREAGDARVLAKAIGRYATALVYVGRLGEAAGLLSEHERIVFTRAQDLAAEAASFRAQLAAAEGDLGARHNAYLAAVELYGAQGDVRNEAGASVNLADVQNRFGQYEEAEAALTKALARCRELRMRLMEGYALVNRGYARLMKGAGPDARADLEAALTIAIAVGDARLAIFAVLYRARVSLGEGQLDRAIADAERVVAEAEKAELSSAELLGRTVLAQAFLLRNAPRDAERAIDLARKKRMELGGVEEDEAEVYATHARILDALGRSERAGDVRATGRERLMATAQRIGDPSLRARFLQGSAAHRELMG